ncbi:thioredoxin [Hymenobacter sp. H14-R3]|uniref:thioredoxin n=1 Tax=Hymenobacter sp. H14-R3 TaxID=3046308 RepID=UPI0024BA70BE|nr:thioredoxin [Hymenobacter sp. H14-R3]MDJ0367657.1 thioredoxin [Hymenobacter sp. H14-R3]
MSIAPFPPDLLAPAVLLVLVPAGRAGQLPTPAQLNDLQCRLGPAVRVLRLDDDTHASVVRSFAVAQLPACVLVREGIELWRQPGWPESDALVASLLAAAGAG